MISVSCCSRLPSTSLSTYLMGGNKGESVPRFLWWVDVQITWYSRIHFQCKQTYLESRWTELYLTGRDLLCFVCKSTSFICYGLFIVFTCVAWAGFSSLCIGASYSFAIARNRIQFNGFQCKYYSFLEFSFISLFSKWYCYFSKCSQDLWFLRLWRHIHPAWNPAQH